MKYVLFVCTQNAGRSQMAEAFFERHAPAESAGQEPAAGVHPTVVEAMAELGIDLSGKRPKRLDLEMQIHADWGVTLACGARCPYVPTVVEEWDVSDPAGKGIEEVRLIRDEIEYRVANLIDRRADEIRSGATPHRARLERLLPLLAEEFGASHAPEEIRACADAILSDYDEVPIRTHVVTLARRRAAECLRTGGCAAVAGAS